MTRTEAFQISAKEGKPITHRFFSPDEYITILPGAELRTEEGYIFPIWEFMKHRQLPEWENDWSLYE